MILVSFVWLNISQPLRIRKRMPIMHSSYYNAFILFCLEFFFTVTMSVTKYRRNVGTYKWEKTLNDN